MLSVATHLCGVGHVEMGADMESVGAFALPALIDPPHGAGQSDGAPARAVAESRQESRQLVARVGPSRPPSGRRSLRPGGGSGGAVACGSRRPRRPVEVDRVGKCVLFREDRPSLPREHRAEHAIGVAQPEHAAGAVEIGLRRRCAAPRTRCPYWCSAGSATAGVRPDSAVVLVVSRRTVEPDAGGVRRPRRDRCGCRGRNRPSHSRLSRPRCLAFSPGLRPSP